MQVQASKTIKATKEQTWKVVTDIEGAKSRISGIKDIEILDKPQTGLVGLKWKETRVMFGKEATETMWITKVSELKYYETQAINCGCVYKSTVEIKDDPVGVELSMSFEAYPKTVLAKLMSPLTFLFSGSIKKAFEKDLEDIQKSLEGTAGV